MILSEFSANAAHTLITVTNHLLDRQVQSLAKDFAGHGGFTERLYHFRKHARFQD
jgi:four helix bundle suffix protein